MVSGNMVLTHEGKEVFLKKKNFLFVMALENSYALNRFNKGGRKITFFFFLS